MKPLAASLFLIASLPAAATPCRPVNAEPLPQYEIETRVDPQANMLAVDAAVTLPAALVGETVTFRLRRDLGSPAVKIVSGPTEIPIAAKDMGGAGADRVWRLEIPAGRRLVPLRLDIRAEGRTSPGLNFRIGDHFIIAGGGSTAWYPQFGSGAGLGALSITTLADFAVVAGGRASEPVGDGGRRTTTITYERPTQFSFAAGKFRIASDGDKVSTYLLDDSPLQPQIAKAARDSIKALEPVFGPFPFERFAIVEVPVEAGIEAQFVGAAFDGFMVMRSDFLQAKGAVLGFFGHEIGHQWWGVSVQNAGKRGDYMLDEALANYGALRAVEQISGAAAAENFRRGGDGLGGRRDGVRLIAAGFDAPLADLPHAPEFYTLSDSKGYLVYDMLARRIGRDRFEDALKDLHCAHRFGDIAWEKVERKLREAAGKQAADFFEQWFYREGMPILSLDWSQSGTEVILSVTQSGEPYTLQLPLRLVFDDGGAAMRSIDIAGARTDVKFKEVRRLRSIELDPQATIFFATPASRADALRRAPVTRGKLFWDNGETEKAVIEFKSALSTAGAADATPTEFLALVYLGWIAEEAGRSGEAEQCYRAALALPVRDQQLLKRAYKNLARVLQQKGDGEEAQRALLNAEAAQGVSDW